VLTQKEDINFINFVKFIEKVEDSSCIIPMKDEVNINNIPKKSVPMSQNIQLSK
jgi:hypothetical protein